MYFERAISLTVASGVVAGIIGAGYGLKLFKPMPQSSVMPLVTGGSVSSIIWNTIIDKPVPVPIPALPPIEKS
jgi:hypothetical protein